MIIDWWMIVIYAVIGAAGVLSVLVLTGLVRPRQDGTDIVMRYIKGENSELNIKIDRLEATINAQTMQINSLQMQVILLESKNHQLPYPSWEINTQNVLVYANPSFENMILKPNKHLLASQIGKPIESFLDAEAAKQYMDAHDWVLSQNKYWEGVIQMKLGNKSESVHMVLYPNALGNRIFSVYGMVIPVHLIRNF